MSSTSRNAPGGQATQHGGQRRDAVHRQLIDGQPRRTAAAPLDAGQRRVVQDDRHPVRGRPDVELQAVDPGDRERGCKGGERVLRRPAMIAPVGQQEHRQPPGVARRSGPVTGMANENVDPDPSSDSAQMRPPWASTMCRAIESPRPVPPAIRVRARSTL